MPTLTQITQSIMQDPDNKSFTAKGIEPLFAAPTTARINIVGQAPGIKAQESRLYWNDKSGDRCGSRYLLSLWYVCCHSDGFLLSRQRQIG